MFAVLATGSVLTLVCSLTAGLFVGLGLWLPTTVITLARVTFLRSLLMLTLCRWLVIKVVAALRLNRSLGRRRRRWC